LDLKVVAYIYCPRMFFAQGQWWINSWRRAVA